LPARAGTERPVAAGQLAVWNETSSLVMRELLMPFEL
jgi:hypothetical protein